MKVLCPKCRERIPAEEMDRAKRLARCPQCHGEFALDMTSGAASVLYERPDGATSLLTRDGNRLTLRVPRSGPRGIGLALCFFAVVWNAVTWFLVLSVLSPWLWPGPARGTALPASPLVPLLLLIPLIVVGLATAAAGLFCVSGRVTVQLDRERSVLRREFLWYRRETEFALANVTAVRPAPAFEQGARTIYGVGIEVKNRLHPLVFGSGLSADEQRWLAGEVNAFWRETTSTA